MNGLPKETRRKKVRIKSNRARKTLLGFRSQAGTRTVHTAKKRNDAKKESAGATGKKRGVAGRWQLVSRATTHLVSRVNSLSGIHRDGWGGEREGEEGVEEGRGIEMVMGTQARPARLETRSSVRLAVEGIRA